MAKPARNIARAANNENPATASPPLPAKLIPIPVTQPPRSTTGARARNQIDRRRWESFGGGISEPTKK
jgi:hypothetical protein